MEQSGYLGGGYLVTGIRIASVPKKPSCPQIPMVIRIDKQLVEK